MNPVLEPPVWAAFLYAKQTGRRVTRGLGRVTNAK